MNVTRDMDSFDVFQLGEDATTEEIKDAFKINVEMFCGKDGNKKNDDGEYLLKIYREHYKILMNEEEKQKLIEKRRQREKDSIKEKNRDNTTSHNLYENALVVPKTLEAKQNYIITSINREIFQKYREEKPQENFSLKKILLWLKKVPLKNTYVIVGADCSLLFADSILSFYEDAKRIDQETGKLLREENAAYYTLKDCFTTQELLGAASWAWFELPWDQGQIFKVNGILSMAFLASKIFPNSLVHDGEIKDSDFRRVYDIIHRYLEQNRDYVASLFEDVNEEEVNKRMDLLYK